MPGAKHPLLQQVGVARAWHFLGFFPNTSQGDFLFKRTKKVFTISTKITSVNGYQNTFQFSGVALASGTSALAAEVMH